MDNVYKNLGNVIRQHRLAKKLSTQELASALDISVGMVSNLENSKSDSFNLGLLYNISRVLEIPLINLILGNSVSLKEAYGNELNDIDEKVKSLNLQNEVQSICSSSKLITEAFLSTIAEFEYKEDAIKCITDKIIHELNYIRKIKKINDANTNY